MAEDNVLFIKNGQTFEVQHRNPVFCLRTLIQQHRSLVYGLRPFREIEENVKQAISLQNTDPKAKYRDFVKLG